MRSGLPASGNHNHETWVPPPVMTMGASRCNYRTTTVAVVIPSAFLPIDTYINNVNTGVLTIAYPILAVG